MENTEEPLLQLPPEETGAEETLPGIAPEPEAAEEAVAPAEAQENNESTETPEVSDIEALLAEAEQRGYLRGRNEAIEASMRTPALLENSRLTRARALEAPDPASLFLSRIRPGVWD